MDSPNPRGASTAVFDLAKALENSMGELEILIELAEIFCDCADDFLRQIGEAVASRNGREIHRTAHTLKGSLSPFCAAAAFQAALRLEELGATENFAPLEEAWQDLQLEVQRLRQALMELLVEP